MGTRLIFDNQEIKKIDVVEKQWDLDADYTICMTDALDSEYKYNLTNAGFRFHDRVLNFEISLVGIGDDLNGENKLNGIDFIVDSEISQAVVDLACQAYKTDRRFDLDPIYNQEKANRVIAAYIEYLRNKIGIKVYEAFYKDELLGFTVVDEMADENRVFFENLLGATKPGIKGKMIAVPLYRRMLQSEADKFKKYRGWVSASNMASINLHIQLGGHISDISDEFIYVKK